MADTLGDLIDKLSICNIRIWHLEDERRAEIAKSNDINRVFGTEQKDKCLIRVIELAANMQPVNRERNDLIDQINAAIRVLVDKAAGKDSTFQLTAEELLGNGKNKFYKTEDHE